MDYCAKYLMITDKYKLSVLDKETIKWQLDINIDFQDIFKNLKDKDGFTIQNYIDNFYTQNIDMLIVESACGITKKGKHLIKQLRNIYSACDIARDYYKEFCKLYKEYDRSIEQLFCMIDNYYIKYKTMSLYHDYYVNIASDKINIEHYKIDEINYLRKYKQTELLTEEGINRMLELLVQEVN